MINNKLGSFAVLNRDDLDNQPLVLLDGGLEKRYREPYDYSNYLRQDYNGYLFQFTISGKGYFEKEGEIIEVTRGKGFMVSFPEKSRYYIPLESEEPWEFIYLHFSGEAALPFTQKIERFYDKVFCLSEDSIPIRKVFQLQKRLLEGRRLHKYEGGEFLYGFLCSLLRELENPSEKEQNSVVVSAVTILEENYADLESIEGVAEQLKVSFAHLSREFKKEMGMTPIQYVTNVRLQAAMNDLMNTKDNLELIATRNGFSNGNYFCKVFRKNLGISPTEFRRKRSYDI